MTIAVILLLGALWVAFLAPTILKARGRQGRADSVGDFHHRLNVLGQTNGSHRERPEGISLRRPMLGPAQWGQRRSAAAMTPAQRRRRDILFGLSGFAAFTLVLAALSRSGAMIAIQVLADATLGGYVYLLVRYKGRAQEQRTKVRYLGALSASAPRFGSRLGMHGAMRGSVQSGPRLVPLRHTASN